MFVQKFQMIPLRLKFLELPLSSVRHISASSRLQCKRFRLIDEVIPKNVMKDFDNGSLQTKNGKLYDYKPFKLTLQKGKRYSWCLCGHSKSQPLCDGTHKIESLEIKLKPVRFEVSETKEYWLCNCKQTKHRPFCDGSHLPLLEEVHRLQKERLLRRAALGKGGGAIEEADEAEEAEESEVEKPEEKKP